jgi:hypothetical protein
MSSENFASERKFDTFADATAAGEAFATSEIGERVHRMSFEVLQDLGLSDSAINTYLSRFCRAEHAPGLPHYDSAPHPSRETVKDEPFFGGGDWHWGVRPSRPDFWE